MVQDTPPSFTTLCRRALRKACPRCGERGLFASFLTLRDRCPSCDWETQRAPGTMTGGMYLTGAINQLFAVAVLIVLWLTVDAGPWTMLAIGLPVIALFSLLFLPYSKSLWLAIEYWTDTKEGN